MAMYPCDVKNHRYNGPQQTIYPAIVTGNASTRRKLRLCPGHFEHLEDTLETKANNAQMDFDSKDHTRCIVCQQDVTDSEFQFFATVYAKGQERRDFWAVLHESCAAACMEDWGLEPS